MAAKKTADMRVFEAQRIKGAVRTDFILSAEIIVITLGTVAGVALGMQVAGIVKIDDLGLYLSRREGLSKSIGRAGVTESAIREESGESVDSRDNEG
ncbi:DUF808 family protein [Halomonas saccharevitans]|uniref:Uncharacterized protein n=1 Tax=Halomonas saccharevitans TaxID=416872 RepID=A0A1I6Z5B0_9GAMM|nr:Protein of unknown function [Halomonas saccharevitans]